ncbi:MAG: UDP-N-acetylglucosamine 1-carboxyvinyltransferase, partial [Exiguobacterium sp.]|nr:UDP-N-acetylglucosamine 1-carboxyvinyltransferase [Exiguobacterium sp.]
GSDIEVIGAEREHLRPLISKMEEMGVHFEDTAEGMRVTAPDELKPVDVKTMPHPGFPTDMQSQMMALVLKAGGTSVITETVFENRFMHVEEFRRMNADIKIEGRSAIVKGGVRLQGAEVVATDLRAGAALILAGLIAEEETRVGDLYHIDRGYVDFHKKLQALGADIERIEGTVEVAEEMVQN